MNEASALYSTLVRLGLVHVTTIPKNRPIVILDDVPMRCREIEIQWKLDEQPFFTFPMPTAKPKSVRVYLRTDSREYDFHTSPPKVLENCTRTGRRVYVIKRKKRTA